MGVLAVSVVIDRTNILLKDPTGVRWTPEERAAWASDCQREVATYKPDALAKTASITLVPGTRQTLPADATGLIDIPRNTASGRAPRIVARNLLDAHNPTWQQDRALAEVRHYTYDPVDARVFHVWPPQPATGMGALDVIYAAAPVSVGPAGDLVLDDTWLPIVINYVMFRAWSKDAEDAANAGLATTYYQAFMAQLAAKAGAETMQDPNRNTFVVRPGVVQPPNPNPPLQA